MIEPQFIYLKNKKGGFVMIKPNLKDVKETLEDYPFPVDIIVEVTRHCNLKCIMCPYPQLKRSKGHMKIETF